MATGTLAVRHANRPRLELDAKICGAVGDLGFNRDDERYCPAGALERHFPSRDENAPVPVTVEKRQLGSQPQLTDHWRDELLNQNICGR